MPHEYYVSISEVEYNVGTRSMEVSIKFIGHDLEQAMGEQGMGGLYLGTEKEVEDADAMLHKYIDSHFDIRIDGESIDMDFIGKEVGNDDFIYCYLEGTDVEAFNRISIKNTLLTEEFELQSNIIHLKRGSDKISFTLTKDHTEETHEFEE